MTTAWLDYLPPSYFGSIQTRVFDFRSGFMESLLNDLPLLSACNQDLESVYRDVRLGTQEMWYERSLEMKAKGYFRTMNALTDLPVQTCFEAFAEEKLSLIGLALNVKRGRSVQPVLESINEFHYYQAGQTLAQILTGTEPTQ